MRRFALVFLPLLVAYAATFVWVFESWFLPESYYEHGPLVIGVGGFVVWAWRSRWGAVPSRVDPRGWWLLGPALLLHLCGAALTIDSLSAASLCLAVPGVAWLAIGAERARTVAPVLGLCIFAVPMPMFLTEIVTFEMKEVATSVGLEIVNALGVGAERRGAGIFFPPQQTPLTVAAPCSGLRSLVALVTLAYCVAFFLGRQDGPRRWVLLALAVPIALIDNFVRIAVICWLAREWGVGFAAGIGHDIVSYAAWALDIGLLLLVDAWFRRRGRTR